MAEPKLTTTNLTKRFESNTAVSDLDFEVKKGEFFSILGPSGCGKTTTLRLIAGFETPTSGAITMDGENLVTHSPHDRDIGMVFQNFALFPNKTVGENVAFGLKMQGMTKSERRTQASEYLDLVDMGGFEDRDPSNLSGGQQQRVALARALVIEPSVLLLDEPLSSLDLKLRKNMRFELKKIQNELETTFIYVTHDQEEAMSMSDRIMLLNEGKRAQVGSPRELYDNPSNTFAANFIGDTNLFGGAVVHSEGNVLDVELEVLDTILTDVPNAIDATEGDFVTVSLRPEDIRLSENGTDSEVIGEITASTFIGKSNRYQIDVNGRELIIEAGNEIGHFNPGDAVSLSFDVEELALLRGEDEF